MTDGVRIHRDGAVLEVTIDRPKANAIDLAMSRRLNQIWTEFSADKDLRIAILTGAGEKFFCPIGASAASAASTTRATSTSRSSRP